jgi:DNA-binding Lrp family transcriptional regulator
MTRHAERICELAHESAAAEEPDIALRALVELRREVDAFVRVHVGRALRAGRSFSDVARALGISRQAVHRRFRDLAPERRHDRRRPLVATHAARDVARLAREEALAAGVPLGSEHVLLGVVRTDTETTRALRSKGVTPERVRAYARSSPGQSPDGRVSSSIRRIVKRAALIALSRGHEELDVEPLLLAAIADADGGARRTLTALSVLTPAIDARQHR